MPLYLLGAGGAGELGFYIHTYVREYVCNVTHTCVRGEGRVLSLHPEQVLTCSSYGGPCLLSERCVFTYPPVRACVRVWWCVCGGVCVTISALLSTITR